MKHNDMYKELGAALITVQRHSGAYVSIWACFKFGKRLRRILNKIKATLGIDVDRR